MHLLDSTTNTNNTTVPSSTWFIVVVAAAEADTKYNATTRCCNKYRVISNQDEQHIKCHAPGLRHFAAIEHAIA